jgi:hypothetical protein
VLTVRLRCCPRADETGCGKYRCHYMPSQSSHGSTRFAVTLRREQDAADEPMIMPEKNTTATVKPVRRRFVEKD